MPSPVSSTCGNERSFESCEYAKEYHFSWNIDNNTINLHDACQFTYLQLSGTNSSVEMRKEVDNRLEFYLLLIKSSNALSLLCSLQHSRGCCDVSYTQMYEMLIGNVSTRLFDCIGGSLKEHYLIL